jgi:hypothetical protein
MIYKYLFFIVIPVSLILIGCGSSSSSETGIDYILQPSQDIKIGEQNEQLLKYLGIPGPENPLPLVADAGKKFISQDHYDQTQTRISVLDYGAVPNDGLDDTTAFQNALYYAKLRVLKNEGTVGLHIGEGHYDLSDILYIEGGGIYLLGEGREKTVLRFHNHLGDAFGLKGTPFVRNFSWKFGMLWFCPDATRAKRVNIQEAVVNGIELEEGSTFLPINVSELDLNEGDILRVILRGGEEMLREASGDKEFSITDHPKWTILDNEGFWWYHNINVVKQVRNTGFELRKPLRLGLVNGRELYVSKSGSELAIGGGISDLSIQFVVEDNKKYKHLHEKGYNAIFLQKVAGVTVEQVSVINADNALILEHSHHNSIHDVSAIGTRMAHHGVSLRNSHDNLVTRWRQSQPVRHGLGVQDFSSGNVFSKCILEQGTLDSHRGMPFDNLRTEIKITNETGYGGGAFGPFAGRRMVSWCQRRNESGVILPV